MLVCVVAEQRALAFTPQQYVVAERHTGNVCALFIIIGLTLLIFE